MAHKLLRLSGEVFNTPQLITAESFSPIIDYLSSRNSGVIKMMEDDGEDDEHKEEKHKVDLVNGIAFIKIEGPLTYKKQQMLCAPEGTSYVGLIEQLGEAIEAGAKTVVFEHDSGGGEARGCFLMANEARDMLTEAGVKSYSFIDTYSASAAYAWAVIADEVIVSPEASAGSIGCICAIVDDSKMLEKEGFKRVVVTSVPGKSPYAEDGSFSEKFLSRMQEDVTRLGEKFIEHVSKYTGLDAEVIRSFDAQMFHAEKALELGLVNAVMTPKQFIQYLTKEA